MSSLCSGKEMLHGFAGAQWHSWEIPEENGERKATGEVYTVIVHCSVTGSCHLSAKLRHLRRSWSDCQRRKWNRRSIVSFLPLILVVWHRNIMPSCRSAIQLLERTRSVMKMQRHAAWFSVLGGVGPVPCHCVPCQRLFIVMYCWEDSGGFLVVVLLVICHVIALFWNSVW